MRQFHESGDLDIAYTAEGLPRFRVNVFRQRGAISFAFRVIPARRAELRAAEHAGRRRPPRERAPRPRSSSPAPPARARRRRSRRCSTTSTGRGASTSSRSRTRSRSSTSDRMSIVNQREVGLDTESFAQALRRVLRQDPDAILIGELRDAETAQTALQAAESGHLVFSTLHTIDAAETVGRMIEFFPPAKQQQIRSVLAGVLRGVISQRLLPRVDARPGRRRRGDGDERAHLRSDPRAAHRGDRGRGRRGRLLRHADVRAGADRARPRRQGRARGRRERGHERARLRGRARPGAQAPDGRGRAGGGAPRRPPRPRRRRTLPALRVVRHAEA